MRKCFVVLRIKDTIWKNHRIILLSLFAVLAVLTSACGGNDELTESEMALFETDTEMEISQPADAAGRFEHGQAGDAPAEDTVTEADADEGAETNESGDNLDGRLIIREQQMLIEVQDLESVLKEAEQIIQDTDGAFIESLHEWETEEQQRTSRHAELVVRIPVDDWSTFEEKLSGSGNVLQRNVRGEDVTEEYIDNASRLRNMEAHEERILALYDEAHDIEDLLRLEEELARIRGNIEELEGRQLYLERVTATVKVMLELLEVEEHQLAQSEREQSVWTEIQLGFKHSVQSILYWTERLTVFFVTRLPYLVMFAVITLVALFGVRYLYRRTGILHRKKNG